MPGTPCDLEALAKSIEAGAAGRDRSALVGIDGPGGTGKSTLAALLAAFLPGAEVVHIDDFYLPSADRHARSEAVAANFDLARLDGQVLRPAVAGARVRYQRYDWDADRLGGWTELPPRTPLIVEGVHALHADLRHAYTHTIHCQAPRDVRLSRGWHATAMRPVRPGRTSGCRPRTPTSPPTFPITTRTPSSTATPDLPPRTAPPATRSSPPPGAARSAEPSGHAAAAATRVRARRSRTLG